MNKQNKIRSLLSEAISVLNTIRINYQCPIGPRTAQLLNISRDVVPLIKNDHPIVADIILNATQTISQNPSMINAYAFGDLRTSITILNSLYQVHINGKRVFISHSSKDFNIVRDFTNHILMLGVGIKADDIFCTSIENLNIQNGEDIRRHINDNIRGADYLLLLLSDNYKKSEICQNEMGAVWLNNSRVRYYLLPGYTFDKIGWLAEPNQAEMLNNAVALDNLRNELVDYFDIDKTPIWSSQREEFLSMVNY